MTSDTPNQELSLVPTHRLHDLLPMPSEGPYRWAEDGYGLIFIGKDEKTLIALDEEDGRPSDEILDFIETAVNFAYEARSTQPVQEGGAWNFDMEAAPKDGTKVLVLSDLWGFATKKGLSIAGDFSAAVCVYEPRSEAWSVAHNQDPGNAIAYNPIAWMPLPTPPTPVVEKDPEVTR